MSVAAPPKHECVRCGRVAERAARTPDGGICRRCYRTDPARMEQCSACGRVRIPSKRAADGKPLCNSCARPKYVCSGCGRVDHAKTIAVEGPLCQRCYTAPQRPCGKCGNVRTIAVRVQQGTVDLCHRCAHSREYVCGLCSKMLPVHTHWPLGAVCVPCYKRSTQHPATCASCGATKVLIGRNSVGELACGPCVGSVTDYVCTTCGEAGTQHYEGTCLSCSIPRLARELLTSQDGTIRQDLAGLPDVLTQRGRADSTMRWLIKARTQQFLRVLADADGQLTHADVDACPPGHARHYLRALLVQAQILPRRDEQLERFETWIDEYTAALPPHQAAVLLPYARWGVLRTARRRATRRGFSTGAADSSRERIRQALRLIEHVEATGHQIGELSQAILDDWTAGNRDRTRSISGFVTWLGKRGIVGDVRTERMRRRLPSEISDETEHRQRIADLLDMSADIELATRVAGLLVLLYGARLFQIKALTTADVTIDGNRTHLTLAQHPIELPAPVGELVGQLTRQASDNPRASTLDGAADHLFPGARPHEPIHSRTLSVKLTAAGIPTRLSRNYALVALTSDLPAAVVATQLGLSASATTMWAKFGQQDQSEYLRARCETQTAPEYFVMEDSAHG